MKAYSRILYEATDLEAMETRLLMVGSTVHFQPLMIEWFEGPTVPRVTTVQLGVGPVSWPAACGRPDSPTLAAVGVGVTMLNFGHFNSR